MLLRGGDAANDRNARWTLRYWTSLLTFLISPGLWFRFNPAEQRLSSFRNPPSWLPEFGVGYRMGVDGISVLFVLLSTAH